MCGVSICLNTHLQNHQHHQHEMTLAQTVSPPHLYHLNNTKESNDEIQIASEIQQRESNGFPMARSDLRLKS